MTELTDLEICTRIAEIEGVDYFASDGIISAQDELGMCREYNLLTDDALCFQLLVKYKVDFIPYYPDEYRTQIKNAYIVNESPNKAICLAIIEANKND